VLVSHAAVFFPIIAGLYWRRVAPAAGFWAILAGAAGGVVSHFFIYEKATFLGAIHPLFFGPILSILVLVVVTVAARSRPSPGA
jgi:Na+/proline symporter